MLHVAAHTPVLACSPTVCILMQDESWSQTVQTQRLLSATLWIMQCRRTKSETHISCLPKNIHTFFGYTAAIGLALLISLLYWLLVYCINRLGTSMPACLGCRLSNCTLSDAWQAVVGFLAMQPSVKVDMYKNIYWKPKSTKCAQNIQKFNYAALYAV